MNINKVKGFSLVEIIIVISILVLLAFIGLNTSNMWQEKTDNSKTISDLSTINNALTSYIKSKNELPTPGGNNYIYDKDGVYSHDWNNIKTFGVSGFITEKTISKSFMNFLPLDSKTKQYYAYAKTKSTLNFQIAGIIWQNGEPKSSVLGNHIAEDGMIDLIKEYNGPNFVFDKSSEYFPFSPDEKDFTARIRNFTGTVLINGNNLGSTGTLDYILREGDKISTTPISYATIFFSDGSKTILGNDVQSSDLTLSVMKYSGENNLITKIKLALGNGTVWNDVTKLNAEGSEFEIYTNDVAAAVRGTEFGVRENGQTNVTVNIGKVELLNQDTTKKLLEVRDGETATGTNIYNGNIVNDGLGASENINHNYIDNDIYLSSNIKPKVISWKYNNTLNYEVLLELNDIFRKADNIKIRTKSQTGYITNFWKNDINLSLNQTYLANYINADNKVLNISICKNNLCSSETEINLGITSFNQANNDLADQKNSQVICENGYDFIDGYLDNNGCVENSLYSSGSTDNWKVVAYAPYDEAGDLKMYKSGDEIQASQSGITNLDSNISLTGSIQPNNNSFYQDTFLNKGIFIGAGDYLKYDLSDLGLTGSGDFAIEMSVKGDALLENLTKYLFDSTSGNGLKIQKAYLSNYYRIRYNNLDICSDDPAIIGDNCGLIFSKTFEKIIFKNGNTLTIGGKTFPIGKISIDNLFIGSMYSYNYHINGIIDYVKIYKK